MSTTPSHFDVRAQQRHLPRNVLEFILDYGVELHARGATHLTVVERRLPPEVRGSRVARRSRDWIVLVGDDGRLVTCFRRAHATRYLRRKPKERTPRDLPRAHHSGGSPLEH